MKIFFRTQIGFDIKYAAMETALKKSQKSHRKSNLFSRRISLLHENGDPATSETPKKRQKTGLKQTRNLANELSKVSEAQERETVSAESVVDVSKFETELEDVCKQIGEKIEYFKFLTIKLLTYIINFTFLKFFIGTAF